jgi:putative nucleotidyltransferase with HDIG domain
MSSRSQAVHLAVDVPAAGVEDPYLLVHDGPARGQWLPIGGGVTIGRSPRCDLRLARRRVSRTHAEVVRGDTAYMVRDLGSDSGTYLNGEPVATAELHDGDRIAVGNVTMSFHLSGTEFAPHILDPTDHPFFDLLAVLANAIESRDPHSLGHTKRVNGFAQATARRLGWDQSKALEIEVGAVLHDIGKIGVPDAIVTKTGPLTPEEEEQMMAHPEIGARMLRAVPGMSHIVPYVLHHHECFDGSGYPHRLAEMAIPAEARLLAAADALDAMTSDRPYRGGLDPDLAIGEIRERSGIQFDPEVADAICEAYRAGELDPFFSRP